MSQVKNLRAMFEQKGDDTSPPDRGRSPGPHSSESPRPLSKVRTNFVAIEKDGRMGLQRDACHEPSPSRHQLGVATNSEPSTDGSSVDTPEPAPKALSSQPEHRSPPGLNTSDMNEGPVSEVEVEAPAGAVSNEPSLNPDKAVDEEQKSATLTSADPTQQPEPKTLKAGLKPAAPVVKARTERSRGREARETTSTQSSTPTRTSTRPSAATAKPIAKPANKSTNKPSAPAGAGKKPESKPGTKPQERTVARRDGPVASSTTTSRTTTTARRPVTSKPTATNDTGSTKPKSKPPAKSIALPGSLTVPTTSATKGSATSRQTHSRQSGNPQANNARSPSRAGVSSVTSKPARKQLPTANNPRPSVGPPPKKAPEDAPKRDAHVDEGFLARMMRPTQASSSKTTDKVPATPPRKSASRPSLASTDTSSRRGSSTKRTGSVKSSRSIGARSATSNSGCATTDNPSIEVAVVEPIEDTLATETALVETVEDAASLANAGNLVEAPMRVEQPSNSDDLTASISQMHLKASERPVTPPAQTEGTEELVGDEVSETGSIMLPEDEINTGTAEAVSEFSEAVSERRGSPNETRPADSTDAPGNTAAYPQTSGSLPTSPGIIPETSVDATDRELVSDLSG
ncbi:hypothetical protein N3K66_002284 [Trichothecium roseum]|uniref:Uncharacterized protein n=1 Tax=Trichothecium roseum TaxID=47278 RepID=A0ACC0VAL3_9HYPO|nr:hypothetical protein N3K66_002284 [Trichothecium roseum]